MPEFIEADRVVFNNGRYEGSAGIISLVRPGVGYYVHLERDEYSEAIFVPEIFVPERTAWGVLSKVGFERPIYAVDSPLGLILNVK